MLFLTAERKLHPEEISLQINLKFAAHKFRQHF